MEERINKLEKKILSNVIKTDIIKSKEQKNVLNEWINNKNNKYSLIYKGNRDSYENFHEKYDNKGSKIMIIESTNGEIFGGYTEKSWIKEGSVPCPELFLFNLYKKKKYYINRNWYIHSSKFIGGQIGFGDIILVALCFYDKYLNNSESPIYGTSSNKFITYETSGGNQHFTIKKMEVYKIN